MFLFYILFLLIFIIMRIINFPHMIMLICTGGIAVCESAMFFLAGKDVAQFWNREVLSKREQSGIETGGRERFRTVLGKRALICFFIYIILGVPALVFLKNQNLYLAIRNILAFNIVPDICGVLASLAFLYLLAAVFYPSLAEHTKKKFLIVSISVLGFLMVFIPRGIIGYALIGLFTGGDHFGCVPIMTHLFLFFWGTYSITSEGISLKNKWALIMCGLLTGISVCSAVFHLRYAFFLAAGALCSFICVLLLENVLRPLDHGLKEFINRVTGFLKKSVISLDGTAQGRIFSRKNRRSLLLYLLGYTVLFLITAFFIFLPIIEMKKSLIWTGDALSQYIPKLHRFLRYVPEVIRSVLHGNPDFPVYDFTSGMGSAVAISFEPIYWLHLILPKSNLDVTYTGLIILRFFLTGLSFSFLLIYFRRSWLASWVASLAYAFSGYALFAGTRHFIFINPLILLPLLLVGIERIIRHRKWYFFTIITTLSLLCSYYFLYMNTIVLGLYFISRILCTKEYRNFKTFISRGLIIVGSYTLGCSMGLISIATHFGNYLNSGRSEGSKLEALLSGFKLFYRQSWISDMFLSSINYNFTPGLWLKIGTVPLALFGAILLFTRDNRRELRMMFCLLTAFCFLPVAAFIFSGFSSVTNRWSYIYSALTGFLIALCLDQMHTLNRKDILFLTCTTLYYGLLVYFDERMQFFTMYADLAFLALTLSAILLINTRGIHIPPYAGKLMLGFITILTLVFNGSHFLTLKTNRGKMRIDYTKYDSLNRISKTSLRDLNQIPEYKNSDDFFRSTNIRGENDTNCFSLVNQHNDLATFNSTMARSIIDYNRMMGNCGFTLVRVLDYNFRTYMHALASVRYLGASSNYFRSVVPFGYKQVYTTKDGLPIYENQYALPLAYTYDTVLADSYALNKDVVTRQELTMNAAIVNDNTMKDCKNLKQKLTTPLLSHEIPFQAEYDGVRPENGRLYIDKDGASITLTFKSDPDSETYIVYSGKQTKINEGQKDSKGLNIKTEDVEYNYSFRTDGYKTNQDQYIFNLGYHTESITSCVLTFKSAGSLEYENLSVFSQPMTSYPDLIEARRQDTLDNLSIVNNTITGELDLDIDKLLVLSLPYQAGWTAWIDDKEVPIYQANYQYIGINVPKGKHNIRFHYQLKGLRPALGISFAGFFVFLLIIVFNYIRKQRKKRNVVL